MFGTQGGMINLSHRDRYIGGLSWVEEFFSGCLEYQFQSSFSLRFSGINLHTVHRAEPDTRYTDWRSGSSRSLALIMIHAPKGRCVPLFHSRYIPGRERNGCEVELCAKSPNTSSTRRSAAT
jgi:hypothetical protein